MLGKIKLSISGANLARMVNELQNQHQITHVKRVHNTQINLTVPANNYAKIIANLRAKCYNINVIQFSPLLRFILFCKMHVCQIVLLLLCTMALYVLGQVVWDVRFCSHNEYDTQVAQAVQDCKVLGHWRANIDCDEVELHILQSVPDISLFNVSVRGCYLVIDYTIKTQPLPQQPKHSGPITAQDSGVVSKMFVTQGTPLVQVGAYVQAGQVLIGDYFVDKDGNTVQCEAQGQVFVYKWDSCTIEFCEDSIMCVPTGDEVVYTSLYAFGNEITSNKKDIAYEHYIVEQDDQYLTKFGIPIHIVYTHVIQTQPTKVHIDFDTRADSLKMQAKEKVLQSIEPQDILEEKYTISHAGDVYFVTYYAKSENLIT